MSAYRCKHCGAVVKRDSDKRWIRSLCMKTGQFTHMWKVPK